MLHPCFSQGSNGGPVSHRASVLAHMLARIGTLDTSETEFSLELAHSCMNYHSHAFVCAEAQEHQQNMYIYIYTSGMRAQDHTQHIESTFLNLYVQI